MSERKVHSGCTASRGSLMNTFPATWNNAMVRATRFLITNITIRRITWRVRPNLLKSMTITGVKANCTKILWCCQNMSMYALGQYPCIWTYRENCCGYCTPKQGLNIIGHHFFSKYRQAAVIKRIFVVHIKPPENSSSPCKTSQQKESACKHKNIR